MTTNMGKLAYQIYGLAVGNVNFQGKPMPRWNDLPPNIQAAWTEVAYNLMEQTDEQIELWMRDTERALDVKRLE